MYHRTLLAWNIVWNKMCHYVISFWSNLYIDIAYTLRTIACTLARFILKNLDFVLLISWDNLLLNFLGLNIISFPPLVSSFGTRFRDNFLTSWKLLSLFGTSSILIPYRTFVSSFCAHQQTISGGPDPLSYILCLESPYQSFNI